MSVVAAMTTNAASSSAATTTADVANTETATTYIGTMIGDNKGLPTLHLDNADENGNAVPIVNIIKDDTAYGEDSDDESLPVTPDPGDTSAELDSHLPLPNTSTTSLSLDTETESICPNGEQRGKRRRRAANIPPRPSAELATPDDLLTTNRPSTGIRRSLLDLPHSVGSHIVNLMPRPTLTRSRSEGTGLFRLRASRSQTDLRTVYGPQASKPMRVPSANVATESRRSGQSKHRSKQGASSGPNGGRSDTQNGGNDDDIAEVERDQYGFRKGNQYLSLEEIHQFEAQYEQVLQRRQEKWTALLREYENGQLPPISSKVKRFIRKGIPANIRGQCWLHYSGAADMMKRNQGRYHQLVALSSDRKYRECRDLIERDLHRTFPENIRFTSTSVKAPSSNGSITIPASNERRDRRPSPVTSRFRQQPASSTVPILQQLRRVLTAFAVRCPSVGYCQSLNYVAGLFLLFMSEEEAFWMLCTVVEQIMPEGMYGVKMEGVTVDQEVLMQLLEDRMPSIYYRLNRDEEEVGAPPITFVTSHWFLTLFVDVLPVECNLRVWDCLFLEGSEVLFRVALTLFKMHEQQICTIDDSLELFQYLQNMPKRMVDCHSLMENCFRKYASLSHVGAKDLERRRKAARDAMRRRVSNVTNAPEKLPTRNKIGHDFGSFFRN